MTNNTTEIQITEEDVRMAYQQKVNQVTNLELHVATLTRVISERDAKIAELEEKSNAKGGKEKVSV
jgi:Tfp pilus assembly protein PilO